MKDKPADSLFWKLDSAVFHTLGTACLFVGVACVGWAALVLLTQALGWLKAGEWQPVPLFSLFLSEVAQTDLQVYLAKPQALNLVPSWGDAAGVEDIAARVARQWLGMRQVLVWLLEWPLVGALLAASLASFMAAGAAFEEGNRKGERR